MINTDSRPTRSLRPARTKTQTRPILPVALVRSAASPVTPVASGSLTLAVLRYFESASDDALAILRAIEGDRKFFYKIPSSTESEGGS